MIIHQYQDFDNEIFFYDISGEHLKPAKDINNNYIESTKYIGTKPLWNTENECDDNRVSLIDQPNNNRLFIKDPLKQQTVFRGKNGEYALEFLLDEFDSRTEYDFSSEPLQVFLGFNSPDEGVEQARVVMDLVDNTYFSGHTHSDTNNSDYEFNFSETGFLTITTNDNFDFSSIGFEKNQLITIDFIDEQKSGTTSFLNHGLMRIEYVSGKEIKINTNELDYKITPFYSSGTTESFQS